MVFLKFGVFVLGIISLCACNTPFSSSEKDQYLESKNAPDLVVKPPLTTSNLSGFYTLPPAPEHLDEVSLSPVS